MLVKNENEWCWCFGGYVGYPQKSIEDAVKDFADTYPAEEVPMIRVGNPYYYIPTVDAFLPPLKTERFHRFLYHLQNYQNCFPLPYHLRRIRQQNRRLLP